MASSGATGSKLLAAVSFGAPLDESYSKEASRGELQAEEHLGVVYGWPGAYV